MPTRREAFSRLADRIMEVLKSKYLTSPIHYEGMRRIEPLELPEEGLREIIYNSICHKLYGGAPIQMRVYNDSVNIWNDGELPMGYTVDTLLGEHGSRPRNHHIAEVFHAAGFIEAWGRGYEKIEESFAAAGLPMPEIEASQGGVWVRIKRRNPFTDVGINVGEDVGDNVVKDVVKDVVIKLSGRQEIMLNLMRHEPTITADEMSYKMSVTLRTIQRDLSILQKNKIIFREGSRKFGLPESMTSGIYRLIKEAVIYA